MYESLRGRLLAKDPSRCVVETGGVGYGVGIPLSTFDRLPAVGEEVRLRLHLAVTAEDWRLFGFASDEERTLFRACLKVSGVGPATALALLSGMSARELQTAVASGDTAALQRVKGIGKKTAERLVVDLRDAFASGVVGLPPAPATGAKSEAAAALVALGLDPAEAADRVRRLPEPPGTTVADLVRRALRPS